MLRGTRKDFLGNTCARLPVKFTKNLYFNSKLIEFSIRLRSRSKV